MTGESWYREHYVPVTGEDPVSATTSFRRFAPRARRTQVQVQAQTSAVPPPREHQLSLTDDEAALVQDALWLAYGREPRTRSVRQKLRTVLGERYAAPDRLH
jgi:hypothetical protein